MVPPHYFSLLASTILFHFLLVLSFFPSFLPSFLPSYYFHPTPSNFSFALSADFFEKSWPRRFLKLVLPAELRRTNLPQKNTILVDYSIGPRNLFRWLARLPLSLYRDRWALKAGASACLRGIVLSPVENARNRFGV